MKRWFDPAWYRYLRDRIGPDRMLVIGLAGLAALFLGGLFTMQAIGRGGQSEAAAYTPVTTTVMHSVRVVERGQTVYKHVPVVKRVFAKPVTLQTTRTVQAPGQTKIVTQPVVRYRPVYKQRVVVVHGKPVTVRQVVTNTRMVTNTVVSEQTNTVVQSETQTVNQTVTRLRTQTQTLPAQTVTVTTRRTETVVVTTTVTGKTATVTLPAVTVTVTTTHG